MANLDNILVNRLLTLEKTNLRREIKPSNRLDATHISRDNSELVSFSCNNYLGLTHHKDVIAASIGASRLVTGSNDLYDGLEGKLAKLKGTETACVFGSGYLTNIGVIPALVKKGDLVLIDKLAHACLIDGVRLSGAKMLRFAHNDTHHLEKLLQQNRNKYDNCLIITDTIFSMDGDAAPLADLSNISKKYDSWLMSDDAHGFNIVDNFDGENNETPADIQMGTLSKYIGSYGGYVCGSKTLIDYLKNTARSLIFSTALPPSVLAAASAAIDVIMANPDLIRQPTEKAQLFCSELGLPKPASPIVPILCGSEEDALQASNWLQTKGFLVVAIRPPTVPKNTSRLRLSFSAMHLDEDITTLANLIKSQNWHKRHLSFAT